MKRTFNRTVKISIIVALFLLTNTFVYAAMCGIEIASTIYISDNSEFSGTERTYDYDNYRLDITPTSMTEGPKSPGEVRLYTELIRPLYRLGIKYGEETKYSGTIIFNTSTGLNVKKKTNLGNCGDGKRYFHFSTKGSWGAGYGALSGNVIIVNY